MRLGAWSLATVVLVGVGCAAEERLAPRDQLPRAVPLVNAPIDTSVRARIAFPLDAPINRQVNMRVTITNTRADTLAGPACADRVDAKPAGIDEWFDITAANIACTRQLIVLPPGASATITATADHARMRALVSGPGEGMFVRVRMAMTSRPSGALVGIQSIAVPIGPP